jgi:hypothetical protein
MQDHVDSGACPDLSQAYSAQDETQRTANGQAATETDNKVPTKPWPPLQDVFVDRVKNACKLLGYEVDEIPPAQIRFDDKNFEDNPFLSKTDYADLGLIVCRLVPSLTMKDWWQADEVKRDAYVREALKLIKPSKGNGVRGRKLETNPQEDQRDYDGWKNSQCRTIEEYAAQCDRDEKKLRWALGRHKKRLAKAKNK